MNQDELDIQREREKAALENCENAVIHNIEWIQPFGYLLACDPKEGVISHASENIAEYFNQDIDNILGKTIDDLLPAEITHQCRNAAGHSTITSQREHVGRIDQNHKSYDVFVHSKQQRLIIEFQPASASAVSGLHMLDTVQRVLERVGKLFSAQALMEACVEELRALTGFHRVKAYRFLSDGAGEVVAESREVNIDSFLGLRFPAYDVPQAARVLYASTPIRIIPSVNAEQIHISKADETQEALDLSLALFRGVVPVHVLYLQNMGVKATLSLPIIVEGQMWGLFAFHHMDEYMLDSDALTAAEILGGSISMLLTGILQRQRLARIEECARLVGTLFVPDESALGFAAYWDTASQELASLIDCDGVGLLSEGRFDQYGQCPPIDVVRKLALLMSGEFVQSGEETIIALDSISTKYPQLDCGETAGVLAIPNPASSYKYLLFFRNNASQNVRWAGAPTKDIKREDDGFRLNPRASFSEYIDSGQKRSDSFNDEDIVVAKALRDSLSKLMSSVTTHRQHRERLGLVIRELNHRVRNMLALVNSIISQSHSTSHDLESFVQALEYRIQALSETQKLLTEFDWEPVHIQLLFERALLPYHGFLQNRIILSGEDVALPPELASIFALVIHELASNAAKYGALSNTTGCVELHWTINDEDLTVQWQEKDGPKVVTPERQGFGSSLIKEALAYEFEALCELKFLPEGVSALFVIPHQYLNIENNHTQTKDNVSCTPPKPFIALLLEDDYVLAKETAKLLFELGASEVDTFPTLERAEEAVSKKHYDFAILDANIRGEFSGSVAELLHQKNIPFAFITGYGSKDQQLLATACIDVLSKPVNKNELLNLLHSVKIFS